MRTSLIAFVIASFTCALLIGQASPVHALSVELKQPIETKAAKAYLIEASTGTVLLAKKDSETFAPASLAKLMTLEIVFDAVSRGEISLQTAYPVSEFAWRTGGAPSRTATMFAALKSQVPVADLIRGIAVQTANDGCLIIAEGMSGSETSFVERMNRRAAELGLTGSHFANATGLPHPENRSTPRDLVMLAKHLHSRYPDLYETFRQPEFEWNKILQRNRNPLLSMGADGLGTGFAEGDGYALVASIERNGRRLFLAISGLATDKERTEEAMKLLNWGLDGFEMRTLFKSGEVIADASVYGGAQSTVPLKANAPVEVYVPINNPDRLQAKITYAWPLRPPVAAEQAVGSLAVFSGERPLLTVPLYANASVEEGTLRQRALDAVLEALFFWL